ncbi:MAG: hypothetical protein OEV33_06185, partial [Armatimonadota bacterium]|nr:hypothetical protein [Armatimonadota bacterium]
WLQAAVFKGDDEVKSPVVWITVEAPEPEPAPQPEELPQESPEAIFGLLPTPKTTSPAQGFQLPFSDGFADEDLDSRRWFRYASDASFEIVEFDDELRISGRTTSREPAVATIQIKAYLNDAVDCSVWFRVQELGCDDSAAGLAIMSDGGAVHMALRPAVGYYLVSSSRSDRPSLAPLFGDETTEWHQLRLTYDPTKGTAKGFVDGLLVGTVPTSIQGFWVSSGVVAARYGCSVDVRFDDFEVKPLGEEAEQLAPPAEFPDEEPKWDRDPWLGPDDPLVPGQIVERRTPYGDYFEYVPQNVAEPVLIAVVSHGSWGDDKMTLELTRHSARGSINERGWLLLADTTGIIVVAPVFDYWRFYGYRYLKGSPIGADDFVFRILDSYREHFSAVDDRIALVGHSAGAQFAQRFLLTHPRRVFAAVLSSAGTYTFPDDTVDWPYGRRNSPNPDGFLEATTLPVRVVMGSLDIEETETGVAQHAVTRVDRADAWVEAMRQLAHDNGLEPRIHLVVIPGARHSAWALDVNGASWLASIIDADRAERQPRSETAPAFPGIPTFPDIPTPY